MSRILVSALAAAGSFVLLLIGVDAFVDRHDGWGDRANILAGAGLALASILLRPASLLDVRSSARAKTRGRSAKGGQTTGRAEVSGPAAPIR